MKLPRLPAFLTVPWGLRLWRLGAVGLAVVLLHTQAVQRESAARFAAIPLGLARHFFPAAVVVERPDHLGLQRVSGRNRELLGFVLTTSPETDDLVGYSGPNNLLVGLGVDGRVVGLELLTSGDTEGHVRSVQSDARVWNNYRRWQPREEAPPAPVVVSGSTLTSLAIAEGLQRKLTGATPSLRFPEPVALAEARSWFPLAEALRPDSRAEGWWRVEGADGGVMGYIVRTAPQADNVRGYRGPTECLVAVAKDRQTLLGIQVRRSYDTPEYVSRVREDEHFLEQCASFNVLQWAQMDFGEAKVEGVSGATQTSYGIAEGLRRRFAADPELLPGRRSPGLGTFQARDWGLVLLTTGAIVMSYLPGRGRRWVRRLWQVVLVGGYGLALGDLLSLALLVGWAQHGAAREIAPGLALLTATALVLPWATRRQIYCQHLCPHGVLQDWLTHAPVHRWNVPGRLASGLRWVPGILLGAAFLLTLRGGGGDLAAWEPFDAWTLWATGAISLGIAGIGLAVSCWVPMAYCRFGCPTGAFLRLLRSRGNVDRWGLRDTAAALLLSLGLAILVVEPSGSSAVQVDVAGGDPITRLGGAVFGTTWSLTTRVALADPVQLQGQAQEQLDQIERMLSHWHPDSATAQFNAARTTRPVLVPPELIQVLEQALQVSYDSGGAFDVTVAPLARALGFGPNPVDPYESSPLSVEEARDYVGWRKLRVDSELGAVVKQHPRLEIDLGALLQGYAADRLADWMQTQGFEECLIDVGGELRAVGAWEVAVEHPRRPGTPLLRMVLEDEALATSGVYRGSLRDPTGARRAHILDPRSGDPVTHDTVLVAVQAPRALQADAWATALLVIGGQAAETLAAERGLTVLVVGSQLDERERLPDPAQP